jgi:hypothetical protein
MAPFEESHNGEAATERTALLSSNQETSSTQGTTSREDTLIDEDADTDEDIDANEFDTLLSRAESITT